MTTHNYQQLNLKTKQKQKRTKQTTRIGPKSQKWRSQGRLSEGRGGGENGGKGTGNKKHKWQVQTRRGRLRIVWEMEKPKNSYVRPMDMN